MVDSTEWLIKKKRKLKEMRGYFLAREMRMTRKPMIKRMEKRVSIGLKIEVEISKIPGP